MDYPVNSFAKWRYADTIFNTWIQICPSDVDTNTWHSHETHRSQPGRPCNSSIYMGQFIHKTICISVVIFLLKTEQHVFPVWIQIWSEPLAFNTSTITFTTAAHPSGVNTNSEDELLLTCLFPSLHSLMEAPIEFWSRWFEAKQKIHTYIQPT